MLHDAEIGDVTPLSGAIRLDNDGLLVFSVESASRGRVNVGSITYVELDAGVAAVTEADFAAFSKHERAVKADAFDLVRDYAAELENKRAAPNVARARRSAERKAEALRLHAAGRSVAYISRALGVSRKQIGRYLVGEVRETRGERRI